MIGEQATRFPKSSLHELLTVLCDRSFPSHDPDSKKYRMRIPLNSPGHSALNSPPRSTVLAHPWGTRTRSVGSIEHCRA